DEITPGDLNELQGRLLRSRLKPPTIDGVIHSALRAMLRDARLLGYSVPDLHELYDKNALRRLDRESDARMIDPYTEEERRLIIGELWNDRRQYHGFIFHQLWTGCRTSEAVALRQRNLDIRNRRIYIRGSRVLGRDGRPKTSKSKRDVVMHGNLAKVLQA